MLIDIVIILNIQCIDILSSTPTNLEYIRKEKNETDCINRFYQHISSELDLQTLTKTNNKGT